jgi:hypothetical protein
VIQQAVRAARDARLSVFFPAGVYRVSDTIVADQPRQRRVANALLRRDDFPCVLWGSTRGGRARIALADNAPGFGDAKNPKPVIRSESYNGNPNVSFNQMIVHVDVDLGCGNDGAIGIDHQGAQGCVTEDVTVVAVGAFAGFRGTHGSGGGASHITVRGGRFGLYLAGLGSRPRYAGSQPSPVISNVNLIGQTEKAILSGTRGPLTLVGASIDGPGVHIQGPWGAWNGALNIVDSIICRRGEGPVITGNRPVCLSNVYFKNAPEIVRLENVPALKGAPQGWTHVKEYAAGPSPAYPVWVDGVKRRAPLVVVKRDSAPPGDLLRPHQWTEPLPSWEDAGVVNVKDEPYAAAGDGTTDDTNAIQKALDESRDVFLPKGIYRIARPLRLRAETRFFGTGVHSKIDPLPQAAAFCDPKNPQPMVTTPDDPAATCTIAFLQLWCRIPGAHAIHWQAGRRSMVRNVRTKPGPYLRGAPPSNHPMILIDGSGGGRWYNALMHMKFPQGLQHRHVLARGTREPLTFYMLNPEHSAADYMVEFRGVRNVNIYGVKAETLGARGPRDLTPVLIHDSSAFRVFGHGGNASPPSGQPLYRIERCSDFLLANVTYQPFTGGADASTWFMVEELPSGGPPVRTPGTECFTLYKRK